MFCRIRPTPTLQLLSCFAWDHFQGQSPSEQGKTIFTLYFHCWESLMVFKALLCSDKALDLVLCHYIDRAGCVFAKPILMWWVRGCPKGTITLVLISDSAIQKDIDSKYIHLQSQKVLMYLWVQRKEANKFYCFYSVWHLPSACARLNFWVSYDHEKLSPWGRDLSLPHLCCHLNCTVLLEALG